jgi:spore coat protein A, manganese oxidase
LGVTRRQFLERSGMAAMALAMQRGMALAKSHRDLPRFRTELNTGALPQFVDPLPVPQVIKPSGYRPDPENTGAKIPYYKIAMRECEVKVHRDMKPTKMWGYGGTVPGPAFEARSGQGLLVEWVNELPQRHFLPIDRHLHGAESDKPEVRAVVHLHGAKTRAENDGYPESWYVPGKSAVYHYPNRQDASTLWYHDHALGINRLNVFAGMFGTFMVRDEFEDSLKLPAEKYEIPLLICDRVFDLESQLNYPVSADQDAPWVPEINGDAVLVNGKLFPYLEVEPRAYRFRLLNAANSRLCHFSWTTQGPNVALNLAMRDKIDFHQIGTDQGLLSAPVALKALTLAPAERADLVVDLKNHAGASIYFRNETQCILQLRVAGKPARDEFVLPPSLRPVAKMEEATAVQTRVLSLVEIDDQVGNPSRMLLNNTHWGAPVTETPKLDSTEIWSFVNTTDDPHPIHLHLVRFQILDRRPFDPVTYWMKGGQIRYVGPTEAPQPNEMGWKDTVRADPGMVTRIIVKFEGYPGRYVWHCHVLEHEDNEMMRPYDVVK